MSFLLELAKRDFNRFTDSTAGEAIQISPTIDGTFIEVLGLATKHHMSINDDGSPVNTKNTHCCLSEAKLIAFGYPVRDVNNEVSLIGHFIKYTDSQGVLKTYRIAETMPDEALGQITCFLNDYE